MAPGRRGRVPPDREPGVLLDVAAACGVDCLSDGYCIEPGDLARTAQEQGTTLQNGDVVLVRTGRMSRWPDFSGCITATPGISLAAATYLCEEVDAMCLGTDAISIDVAPTRRRGPSCPSTATCSRRPARP